MIRQRQFCIVCYVGLVLGGVVGMTGARELCEGVSLVRPMLKIRRQKPRKFLEAIGQEWREDDSNKQIYFARNFLRHHMLAAAESGPYPAAIEALVRFGEQACAETSSRLRIIEELIEKSIEQKSDGEILIHQKRVGDDPDIMPEALIEIWKRKGWPRQDLSSRHLKQLTGMIFCDSLTKNTVPNAVDLPGGIHARLTSNGLSIQRNE